MLKPVSFSKARPHDPRISPARLPGKHDARFWTEAEDAIIAQHFSSGGANACLARLGSHRSKSSVYQRAAKLGLAGTPASGARKRHVFTPDIDEAIREGYQQLNASDKGAVAALAERIGIERWVLTKRATVLGLTVTHRKEPPWTAAEDALMARVPLHKPDKCAKIFNENGFLRSATAIIVRAKRLGISRRAAREELSATRAAAILGVDGKWVTGRILDGSLPAIKREDLRRAQQGGSAWDIRPDDLRRYVLDHMEQVDLRKVDKVPFLMLIANETAVK